MFKGIVFILSVVAGLLFGGSVVSDNNKTVLLVAAPDMFITPQHTVFSSSEAMPIAGDTSLDGSKVFDGYVWILK